MNFELKENVIPCLNDLIALYNDVGWSNYTNNPNMLQKAYDNSLLIITAWCNEELLGSIRIVGDGFSIIYVQDIVVLRAYQHLGIGSKLITEAMRKYKDVYQKVLLTDNEPKSKAFYEKMEFVACDNYGCVSFVKYTM
jgi:ribosomal protein S18 acetylase RimI-like enzyme